MLYILANALNSNSLLEVLVVRYEIITQLDDFTASLFEGKSQQQGFQGCIQGALSNVFKQYLRRGW